MRNRSLVRAAPFATAHRTTPRALLAPLIFTTALALAAALSPATASAQAEATTGVVRGTVRDPAGTPVAHGSSYVTCSDGSTSTMGACPAGASVTGPVLLYLQSATVPGVPADELGLQSMTTNELAFLLQDTCKPSDRLTLNMGVRWEGAWHPNVFIRPEETVYAPYLSDPRFPSDGTIPDDLDNVQPLPEQRRCGGAGAGARHRRADRGVRGRALPARHPGRRPEPQAAAHLVLRGGGDPRAQLRRDRERLLAARTHRRPLPLRGSERRRAGLAVRDRDAPVGRGHQRADRGRVERALTLSRPDAGAARPGRSQRLRIRREPYPGLRPLRRRQRARPVHLPLRRSALLGRRVRLVGPRPAPTSSTATSCPRSRAASTRPTCSGC